MAALPLLAITPGDPDGIGPEITEKVLGDANFYRDRFRPLLIGDPRPFEGTALPLRLITDFQSELNHAAGNSSEISFLAPSSAVVPRDAAPGWFAGWAVETAARLCLIGHATALATGPIDKDRLQRGGYPYFGHTDLLADVCNVPRVTMMLANDRLRVSLVTIHQSLASVSASITPDTLTLAIQQTAHALRADFGIPHPRLAILGLNPHCGEKGLMGKEEIDVIVPTISALTKSHSDWSLSGPFPADTFFAMNYRYESSGTASKAPYASPYDAVIALYHDQGLIPVKMIDFDRTVNLTLGLPIIRTSVDHGTAFDIAGQGRANPASLRSAIELALEMTLKRNLKKTSQPSKGTPSR